MNVVLARVAKVSDCTACSKILFALIEYQYKITQYNTLNVNKPDSQPNRLKSGITYGTEVTLKFLQTLLVILMMKIILHKSYY